MTVPEYMKHAVIFEALSACNVGALKIDSRKGNDGFGKGDDAEIC